MKAPAGAPTQMVVNSTWQWIFTIVLFTVMAIVLLVAIRRPVRDRDWAELRFRLLVLIGGAAGAFCFEGAVDLAGDCWYAVPGQWGLIDLFGNHVQLWVLSAYFWFVGGFALFIILKVREGAPPSTILKLAAVIVLADLALEIPILKAAKLYSYYGANQPLFSHKWFPLPAWYLTTNALFPIMPALLVLGLMSTRRRHVEWAIPFVMVSGCYACYGTVAWPVILTVHSGLSKLDTTLAALLTMGLGAGGVYVAANIAPKLKEAMAWYGRPSTSEARQPSPFPTAPLRQEIVS